MEEKLSVKTNAVELLDKQLSLRVRKGQYGLIVMSSATDPYLQFEKTYELTRQLLQVIHKHRFPVHIITKSDLVWRDFELLQQIAADAVLPEDLPLPRKPLITFSFSTVSDEIASVFEPGATKPSVRLKTMETVLQHGALSGVSLMPLIPYVSDTAAHLQEMFETFRKAGIHYIFPSGITLFGNESSDSKTLMFRAIEKHYPQYLDKYKRFFANNTNLPRFYAEAFYKKMKAMCAEFGIPDRIPLIKP